MQKNAERDNTILELRDSGETYRSIANKMGVTTERIRQICSRVRRERADRRIYSRIGLDYENMLDHRIYGDMKHIFHSKWDWIQGVYEYELTVDDLKNYVLTVEYEGKWGFGTRMRTRIQEIKERFEN